MDKDTREMYTYLLLGLSMTFLVIYLIVDLFSYRHTVIDGKFYKAVHIKFPGHTTYYKPTNEIDLSKWVGSGIKGIKVEVHGTENPEIEASIALKALGIADSTYHLEKKGEHYFLISPEKSWEEWDWSAYHRIGNWKFDDELNKTKNQNQ